MAVTDNPAGLVLVKSSSSSSSSAATADPSLPLSGVQKLIRRWGSDILAFTRESFTSDPAGNPIFIDPCQEKILTSVQNYDRSAIRTARGVGKTASCAITVHWWLSTRYPALVLTSAGIWDHLKYKLWPEIRNWGRNWLLNDAYEYLSLELRLRDDPDAVRAFSATSDDPEHVEGGHSPHLLIAIDEAKSLPEDVYTALLGSLTNAGAGEEQKIVVYSTPPLNGAGWFTRVSTSAEWNTVHVSGLDSPRVSRAFIDEILREYGEGSPEYQSFVLGIIPDKVEEVLIQSRWVSACQELPADPDDTRYPVVVCDVAREGEDLTIIGVFRNRKFQLAHFEDGRYGWFAHQSTDVTVSRIIQAVKQYGARAAVVDATGVGGGLVDQLRAPSSSLPRSCSVIPINFGERPARPDRFDKRKDELWWQARTAIEKSQIALPTSEELRSYRFPRGTDFISQLTSPKYEYLDSDKINVLDKRQGLREKTRDLPTKSPDVAHAFILGVRYYLRQSFLPKVEEPPKTKEEALGRRVNEILERERQRGSGSGGRNPLLR